MYLDLKYCPLCGSQDIRVEEPPILSHDKLLYCNECKKLLVINECDDWTAYESFERGDKVIKYEWDPEDDDENLENE